MNRIVVELVLDADKVPGQSARVRGEITRIGKEGDRASGALERMGGFLKGLVAGVIINQLGRIARGLYDIATAAEETGSKFRTVFGPAAEQVDAFLRSFANLAGLTQTEGRAITSTLGAMAQGFGLSQQESAEFSEQIVRLAGDMASFNNASIEDTLQAIQSGLTGEQEPLRRYGILLNDAAVKQRALAMTGKASEEALTEQDKVLARLVLISERAGVAVGDLARTQDSAANSGRRMAAQVREAGEAFASELLVSIQNVQARLASFLGDGQGLIEWAREAGRELGGLVEDVGELADAFGDLSEATGATRAELPGLSDYLEIVRYRIQSVTWVVNGLTDAFAFLTHGFFSGRGKGGDSLGDGLKGLGKDAADVKGRVDRLAGSLAPGGTGGGGGKDLVTALEEADEAAKNLGRRLSELIADREGIEDARARAEGLRHEVEAQEALIDARAEYVAMDKLGLERLIAMRLETAELRAQINAYKELVDQEVRRRIAGEHAGQGSALALRPQGASMADEITGRSGIEAAGLDTIPATMEGAFIEAESGIVGTLNRISGHVANFANSNERLFGDLASGLGVTFDALGSMASDFFEASGRESRKAFVWQKRIATAQAIVSTLTAANNALQDVRPFPLNVAAAAAIMAAGYARVRAINAQQMDGGAGAGAEAATSGRQFSAAGYASAGAPRPAGSRGPAPSVTATVSGPIPVEVRVKGEIENRVIRLANAEATDTLNKTRG